MIAHPIKTSIKLSTTADYIYVMEQSKFMKEGVSLMNYTVHIFHARDQKGGTPISYLE